MSRPEPQALLTFERQPADDGLRTHTVHVYLKRTHTMIASIAWHKPYRQYVFVPLPEQVYTVRLIQEIKVHIKSMMRAWSRRASNEPFDADAKDYATYQREHKKELPSE